MADSKAQQLNINLSGSVHLDSIRNNIKNYDGFNYNNALFLDERLAHWTRRQLGSDSFYEYNGKEWSFNSTLNRIIYGGNEFESEEIELKKFVVEETTKLKLDDDISFLIDNNNVYIVNKDYKLQISTYLSGLMNLSAAYVDNNKNQIYITLYNGESYKTYLINIATETASVVDDKYVISGYIQSIHNSPSETTTKKLYSKKYTCYDTRYNMFETAKTDEKLTQAEVTHDFWYGNSIERSFIVNTTYGEWKNGRKIPLQNGFSVLEYNNEVEAISYNYNRIVNNVSRIVFSNDSEVYYMDTNNILKKVYIANVTIPEFQIVGGRYIALNTTSYLNTIDMQNLTMFSRSDDYNNRFVIHTGGTLIPIYYATSHNEQVYQNSYVYSSAIMPKTVCFGTTITSYETFLGTDEKTDVNVYIGQSVLNPETGVEDDPTIATVPTYKYTIRNLQTSTNYDLIGLTYPTFTNSASLYPVPVTANLIDTYLNTALSNEGDYSFLLYIDQFQNFTFGYNVFNYVPITNIFMLQGQAYGISGNYITEISITNGSIEASKVIASVKDMTYVGSLTDKAFFYSSFDRCFYAFTGSQMMTKYSDGGSISSINCLYCNPSTNIVAIGTNIGIVFLYQNQISLLPDLIVKKIYFSNDEFQFDNYIYSIWKDEGEVVPIDLETMFYGKGDETKNINDCIYVRFYSPSNNSGSIKFKCETLTDKSSTSDEKTFLVDKNKWDDNNQMLIRYQPRFQEAIGFSFSITSDFDITSITIGVKPTGATAVSKVSL